MKIMRSRSTVTMSDSILDTDKRNCLLVSRVASLGKLRHQPKGYSGPLSRHLMGYHSIISTLRASLRDLVEISLVTMFLDGNADRDRNDWMDLALGSAPPSALPMCSLAYLKQFAIL